MSTPHQPDLQQGFDARGCPHCVVLHPELSPCPRCNGGAHVQPAQMLDADGVRRAVGAAVDALDGTRVPLDALLQLLFAHRPVSLAALSADGRTTIEQLRELDRLLDPTLLGLDQQGLIAALGPPHRRRDDEWQYDLESAPAHRVRVHALQLHDGRVVAQRLLRRIVDCDS